MAARSVHIAIYVSRMTTQHSLVWRTQTNIITKTEEMSKSTDKTEKPQKRSLMRADAEEYSKKLAKRGVVYLSRIPPFMKPNKMRVELEEYGEITRLYLAEEDPTVRKRRKAAGGNGSKQFVEGWVEFADKRVAKQVAESLNNTPMGGRKRNFYHDDIWNIKYLKGFKWDNLTEKFAYERRVRENKLRAAMLQAKKQNAEFVEMVEQEKAYKHITERKRKRGEDIDANKDDDSKEKPKKRKFKQLRSLSKQSEHDRSQISRDIVSSVFQKDN